MSSKTDSPTVRILPEDVANKIAAGEVVERPASVVKELLENALDAGATRITVRVVAAGRRLIEVTDNGHGMSEQNALLAIERHATSKIRSATDLEGVRTMGFRGEALASIASVSRFVLVTRRAKDDAGTRIRIDGGVLRDVEQIGTPPGTRVSVNRLYFNTPVRAKFLKGITTELGHCIDAVQRHALAREGVGFQFFHNDKLLLDVPEHASLRERVALIWGLSYVKDMVEVAGERAGFRIRGIVGTPALTRSQRSHQFFFMNDRPVINRSLQYGLDDGFRGLITIGRHPVGVLLMETHPRLVDVNIHPAKREIRFRDERAARDAVRDVVRESLAHIGGPVPSEPVAPPAPTLWEQEPRPTPAPAAPPAETPLAAAPIVEPTSPPRLVATPVAAPPEPRAEVHINGARVEATNTPSPAVPPQPIPARPSQPDLSGVLPPVMEAEDDSAPGAVYHAIDEIDEAPLQFFDTYLLVPGGDRLLIIDQHALHERLNYDSLLQELQDRGYASQQLVVPMVLEVAPSQVKVVETNLKLFAQVGIEIEPFGGNTFQVTAICHLYDEKLVRDAVYRMLDELSQGDLFDKERLQSDILRLATRACKASVRGGDRLSPAERRALVEGFRRLRPPYTCPHGRPIITEITLRQVEKSFRRIQ
jgi:DNA mismatch repair protein MutL